MLLAMVIMMSAPDACTDVRQQCRTCTTVRGRRICSGVGIACQPLIRICRPRDGSAPTNAGMPKVPPRS